MALFLIPFTLFLLIFTRLIVFMTLSIILDIAFCAVNVPVLQSIPFFFGVAMLVICLFVKVKLLHVCKLQFH